MALYFAYGSNLSAVQMRQRCPSAAIVGRAVLPKHRLRFGGWSYGWGGAVATLERDRRTSTSGRLYELGPADLAALDACEGVPHVYERVTRYVRAEDGRRRRAQVYVLRPELAVEGRPAGRYFAVLLRAYRRLGFDLRDLACAYFGLEVLLRASMEEQRMTTVFVYGSLRLGQANHAHFLERAHFVGEGRTRAEFTMLNLGAFPGVVAGGRTAISGEVYRVDDATLAALDRLEGHPRMYMRTPIALEDGSEVQMYVLNADYRRGRPVVESGDWLRRTGGSDADRDA